MRLLLLAIGVINTVAYLNANIFSSCVSRGDFSPPTLGGTNAISSIDRLGESSRSAVVTAQAKYPTKRSSFPSWFPFQGTKTELTRETLAGLVVALATIPTSVAYSSIVGVSPLTGLWTSVVVGMTIVLVGGAPGVIAGSAGVIALPLSKLYATYGAPHVASSLLLAAVMEVAFGAAKLGKLAKYATEPVVAGFLNAFAVFLVKSQMKAFRYAGICTKTLSHSPRTHTIRL